MVYRILIDENIFNVIVVQDSFKDILCVTSEAKQNKTYILKFTWKVMFVFKFKCFVDNTVNTFCALSLKLEIWKRVLSILRHTWIALVINNPALYIKKVKGLSYLTDREILRRKLNPKTCEVIHIEFLKYIYNLLFKILYTALNSPSLIFALYQSETDSPILEFAHSPISLHNPVNIIELVQF